ncbi:hypothetical protein [Aminobacterium sp. UBA5514]|mgnify:CR=1 FL=1|uniref:hypothetical protein n=1 Tax=Aminobacterium sp. UBA5514 TaxID=1946036 RepID=UPI00257F23C3|nr:hypothetical protein [Aminobacterium sp. UBA5514]
MEHFIKLSEAVEHTLQKARKLIQDIDKDNAGKNMTIQEIAALIGVKSWVDKEDISDPYEAIGMGIWINISALAWEMRSSLTVYELAKGVPEIIRETEIRSLPSIPPFLLHHGWIIESRKISEPLFGDTVCLGGYSVDNKIFLIGFERNGRAMVVPVTPCWGETDIETNCEWLVVEEREIDESRKWAIEAMHFATILGALLEAETAPIKIENRTAKQKKKSKRGKNPKKEEIKKWTTRIIRLSEIGEASLSEITEPSSSKLDTSDLVLETVKVKGHIKRVAVGKGRKERKWIYVAPYLSSRWVSEHVKIIVKK